MCAAFIKKSPVLFIAVLVAGCSFAHPEPYSSADAPERILTKESNGLRVSVDVVLDAHRSQKYFATDAVEDGIVPVFVRVENISNTGGVLVEKERFKIAVNAPARTGSPTTGEVQHDSSGGEAVLITAGVVGATPLMLVGASMISTADEVRHSFVDKEFRNQSLSPGHVAQGFVYCQITDRHMPIKVVNVSIQTRDIQTEQQTPWEFIVHAENNLN